VGIATGSAPTEPVQLANADGVITKSDFGENLPYVVYDRALGPGEQSGAKDWAFLTPAGVGAFEFSVRVEANTAIPAPPPASSGSGSPFVLVRTLSGKDDFGYLNGPVSQALFSPVPGMHCDAGGNLYLADHYNHAIRRISRDGWVSTVAGVPGIGLGDTDGSGNVAKFKHPTDVDATPDGRTLFIADFLNHKIRIAVLTGPDPSDPANWTVSTIAGTGAVGKDDGSGTTATFYHPASVAAVGSTTVFVTESVGNRIRVLRHLGGSLTSASNWNVSLVAGDDSAASGASGTDDGTGSDARFHVPRGIAVDRAGVLYVADSNNNRIRRIVMTGPLTFGTVSTLAGSDAGYQDSASGSAARFNFPFDVAVDQPGYVFVTDLGNHRIRRVSPSGAVETVAGTGAIGGTDGPGTTATLALPIAIAIDPSGNIYVSDGGGSRIRLLQRVINQP
ncbi:MAG: hypothetical protein RMK62_11435, partial [Armatimonadota bacterium]|nr:hypothetical protein [Armatimonadota bacterium]